MLGPASGTSPLASFSLSIRCALLEAFTLDLRASEKMSYIYPAHDDMATLGSAQRAARDRRLTDPAPRAFKLRMYGPTSNDGKSIHAEKDETKCPTMAPELSVSVHMQRPSSH